MSAVINNRRFRRMLIILVAMAHLFGDIAKDMVEIRYYVSKIGIPLLYIYYWWLTFEL